MWILLVEDEKQLANSLKRGLEEEGHVVEVSYDGEEAELLKMGSRTAGELHIQFGELF